MQFLIPSSFHQQVRTLLSSLSATVLPEPQPRAASEDALKNIDPLKGLNWPVISEFTAPRFPIVLCHGLYGFDKLGPDSIPLLQIEYWQGIRDALAKLGARVVFARVPSTGSIRERALALRRFLETSLPNQEINLVGHSMGGLDARYLITHLPSDVYTIRSLTTISTPHRGSFFMDWCRDNLGLGRIGLNDETAVSSPPLTAAEPSSMAATPVPSSPSFFPFTSNPLLMRLTRALDAPAYANLTTDFCTRIFNPNTPDSPNIAYYSYGAVTSAPASPLLMLPHRIVTEKDGPNDGLVSVRSARWGRYLGTLQECDHWELNKRKRRKGERGKWDVGEFYVKMATVLYLEGF
ncbi:uncharacterized protein VTP21DRAFT_2828 [Calcarisporiella thermophila]|uniref:uncharacterized protein n=1 Tax=Calcarisporiella thermophila TaxID=911321 RepID=UPI003744725B